MNVSFNLIYFYSALPPIEILSDLKRRQIEEKNHALGVDCMNTGELSIILLLKNY